MRRGNEEQFQVLGLRRGSQHQSFVRVYGHHRVAWCVERKSGNFEYGKRVLYRGLRARR